MTHLIDKPQVAHAGSATDASRRYDTQTGKLPPAGTGCGVAGPFGRRTRWTGKLDPGTGNRVGPRRDPG